VECPDPDGCGDDFDPDAYVVDFFDEENLTQLNPDLPPDAIIEALAEMAANGDSGAQLAIDYLIL